MSKVEEVLKILDRSQPTCLSFDEAFELLSRLDAILHAGQALANASQEVLDVDLYGGYERRLNEAVRGWDAVLKGDDND